MSIHANKQTKNSKNSNQRLQQDEQLVITNSYSKISMNVNKKYSNRKTMYSKHYKPINIHKTSSQINNFDNKSASVVNLEFEEGKTNDNVKGGSRKTPFKGLNTDKRANYTTIQQASKRIVNIYKQNSKIKYQQLFKQSVNDFFKTTLQIGPYVKALPKQKPLLCDPLAQRKLLNIQKASFPYRQSRPLTRGKTAYTRLSKQSSVKVSSREEQHQRMKSFVVGQNDGMMSDRREEKVGKKRNLLEAIMPVRKPNNRKDYFVFGMADRTCTTENKIQMFRDLLWKVNYSNNLFVFTPENINNQSQTYKFYVGPGNNCNLIKGILKRRFWWTITNNKNQEGIHFIWTQLKLNQFFKQQQPKEITNYSSTKTCIDSEEEQIIDGLTNIQSQFNEISKVFNCEDVKNWRQHYKKNQKSQKSIQQNTYKRRSKLYQKKQITKIQQSTSLRMHNHLISNFFIGNKKALFYNIKHFSLLQQKSPFIFIPHTFHLKKGTSDPQYQTFLKYFTEMQSEKKTNKTFKNMWIVKPGENTNRGNGITVAYGLDDIRIRLNGRERNRDGQFRTFIIQKYIQNPMLYNKRKFDIRHYALVTCINGIFKFYWYEEGYIRTSSSEFNMKVNRDPLIHLTNDAIQKNTPDYGKYEKGNKLSYQDFQKYLQTTYPTKKYNLFEQILPKMKQYAGEAFKASYSILDQKRFGHNFQLLGLDFMIDEHFQPWLIQINTNPCLQLSSPLLARLIPNLIQNVTRLTLDPLFPPPQNWPANKRTFFSEDPLGENKFSLVFDQLVDGKGVQEVFKDGKRSDANMGKIEEEDQTYEDDGKEDWEDKDKKEQ